MISGVPAIPPDVDWNALVFIVGTLAGSALLLTSGWPFASGLLVACIALTLLWLLNLYLGNASIVDVFWGVGFIIVGVHYLTSANEGSPARGWIVLTLVAVWGLRLAIHIGLRIAGSGEDFRYRKWRDEAGPAFWWVSYFKVFLLQAIVLWIVSSPLLLARLPSVSPALGALDVAGLALWVTGFLFESVADWQLAQFKNDPRNKSRVMRSGLWSLSRHPNYFGEALLWWGIALLAFPGGGWLAFLGPLMITFLLVRVSGVTMLDAALIDRRPGYADYMRSTRSFFPLPRRLSSRQPGRCP